MGKKDRIKEIAAEKAKAEAEVAKVKAKAEAIAEAAAAAAKHKVLPTHTAKSIWCGIDVGSIEAMCVQREELRADPSVEGTELD